MLYSLDRDLKLGQDQSGRTDDVAFLFQKFRGDGRVRSRNHDDTVFPAVRYNDEGNARASRRDCNTCGVNSRFFELVEELGTKQVISHLTYHTHRVAKFRSEEHTSELQSPM